MLVVVVTIVFAFVAGLIVGNFPDNQSVTIEASPVQEGYVSGKSSGYTDGILKYSVMIKLDYADAVTVNVTSGYFDSVKISERVKVTYTQQGWVIVEAP